MGKHWVYGALALAVITGAADAHPAARPRGSRVVHAMQSPGGLAALFGVTPPAPRLPPGMAGALAQAPPAVIALTHSPPAKVPAPRPAQPVLSPAAARRQAIRENYLGVEYDKGIGEPQSAALAAYWYGQAARLGYPKAQYNLANDYYFGRGVPQSYIQANAWFRVAARQGYKWAQWSLGKDEYYGRGGPKNWPRALYWLEQAAAQGLYTFELNTLQIWQRHRQERAEARAVPPSSGCTSQSGPRRLTVIDESPDGKQIHEVDIDGSPSPLFGVNEYLAPGHEMVFPTFPYANDPENYTVTLVGAWHSYSYRVQSCNQMTIVFRQ
jgi:hypothetical protein